MPRGLWSSEVSKEVSWEKGNSRKKMMQGGKLEGFRSERKPLNEKLDS